MFKLATPSLLYLLALAPLMLLFFLRAFSAYRKRVSAAIDPDLVLVAAPKNRFGRWTALAALSIISAILLSIASAWPMSGSGTKLAKSQGVDVVVAVDVSKSMLAKDVTPSRLDRAKLELKEFIKKLSGDRVGIVVFAGDAFVQCPLTTDYDAARLFIRSIDRESVPQGGTSLKNAIAAATDMLKRVPEGAKSKVLVLLTDGEDHEGSALEEAKKAAEEGVVIYAIGIGSASGEPVPEIDKSGAVTGYKKDKAGQTVLSKLNDQILGQISAATGGEYVHATDTDMGLGVVLSGIAKMEKTDTLSRLVVQYEPRFRWFLLPALLFMLAAAWIPVAPGVARRLAAGRGAWR